MANDDGRKRSKLSPSDDGVRTEEEEMKEEDYIEETEGLRDKSDNESEDDEEKEENTEKLRRISTLIREYFGERELEEAAVEELIEECFRECDRSIGEEVAIEWSKDENGVPFQLKDTICEEDLETLRSVGGNLTDLVKRKQERLAANRFSTQRVIECVPADHPEFDRLMDIAQGVEIVVREDFKPSAHPKGGLRQSYLRVASAVNKTLAKSHEEGLNIILPKTSVFGKTGVNAVFQHFALNYPKPEGRAITDSSKARHMKPEEAVNSLEGKEKMKERWGELTFPTIQDLTRMILEQVERVGWVKLRLWKADIRGAYGQLYVAPKDAFLLVAELTDEKCVTHITSGYGFTGTGYAFGPITRVVKDMVRKEIAGGLEIYCDDFQGACAEDELISEKAIAYGYTTRLLGPRAFAGEGERDKYEAGRMIEWIGWEIDLDERIVSLASRNFKKTLYEFFKINVNEKVSLRTMERLAAFASRYCLVARQMRPFVHHLHAFKNTFSRERRKTERKKLSEEARLDIYLWRTFLTMMGLKKGKYCRKITSFSPQIPTGVLFYDSCLTGLGFRIYKIHSNGAMQLRRIASIITPYQLMGLSKFQNTMEFSSTSVGFLVMAEMGWKDIPLKIIGDNKASLTWCAKERFRSTVARGAAMMFMSIGVEFNFWVEESEFVKSEDNIICDRLSRRSETDKGEGAQSATSLVKELGMDPRLLWEVEKSPLGKEMIELCDPLLELHDDLTFNQFTRRMRELISYLKRTIET